MNLLIALFLPFIHLSYFSVSYLSVKNLISYLTVIFYLCEYSKKNLAIDLCVIYCTSGSAARQMSVYIMEM